MKKSLLIVLGMLVATLAGQSARASEIDFSQCSLANPLACLNGVSGVVTTPDALRVIALLPSFTEADVDRRERQARLRPVLVAADGNVSGLGLQPSGWGVWAGGSRARFEGDLFPYDAELDTLTLGVDRLFAGRFLLGGALVHERLDTRTAYNAGGQEGKGNTVMLYGSYLVTDAISLDLMLGKGRIETTQRRIDPAAALLGTLSTLRAAYDSDRTLWSLTLNASRQIGAVGIGGRIGYLDTRERQDGYLEFGGPSARLVGDRTVSLSQAFAGIDASYGFNRNWQMHGAVLYRRDTSSNDGRSGGGLPNAVGQLQSSDRDEFEWIVGLRFYGGRGLKINLEYLHTAGRDQFKNESLTLTGRFDF